MKEKLTEKFVSWWKQDKRYVLLLKTVLIGSLPLLCCLVACAMEGKSIGQVYLPASEWNDELFYFKQVEGIVNFGYPQGYFGFNESHALKLSFAAWSPVLVFPWILWGLVFGWNLLSPIVCNIVLLTLAVSLFAVLTRPSWKQTGIMAFLFCLYTPFVRYMLSGMPEVICFSLLIIFYAVAVSYLRRESKGKLAVMFLLSGLLTLMRPYLILFLFLPVFLWVRKSRWKGLLGSGVIVAAVGAMYALIKHYLGAEYFAPLFFTEWITTFFDKGIGAGISNFFGTLYWMGKAFLGHTVEGFRSGLASGAFFGGYLVMMAVLLWQSWTDFWKLRKTKDRKVENRFILEVHLAFSFVGMLFALLLMYKLTEGSKHLLTFMAAGVFVVSLMETKFYKKAVIIGAVFAYLYTYKAVEPYDYQVPFSEPERVEQVNEWQQALQGTLTLTREKTPNFENVVIWQLGDMGEDGSTAVKWQVLYALPKGFGISCCDLQYVTENFDGLQSRYIATLSGGSVDGMCKEAGYAELHRDKDVVLYERY